MSAAVPDFEQGATSLRDEVFQQHLANRKRWGEIFKWLTIAAVSFGVLALVILLVDTFIRSQGYLTWDFLTSFPSRRPAEAGILSALVGSIYMMLLVALFSIPLGLGAAIYLEEYSRKGWLSNFIEVNISNLAGVPSIVYGLLGLAVFVRAFGLGRSLIAGSLTMSLLILPIIIVASREALRAVPNSIREAGFALGATRWQVVRMQVLPLAFPGILTGAILGLSRAIGETAPLITIGALTFIAFTPDSLFSAFTVLPIQIYNWASRPQEAFTNLAAAGIIVLLVILLAMNSIAVYLRYRARKAVEW
jgi:phosphate transport system permease protein